MRRIHAILTTDNEDSDLRFIARDIATELNCACTFFFLYEVWEEGLPVRYYIDRETGNIEKRGERKSPE